MSLTTTVDQDNLIIAMTIIEYRSFWEQDIIKHADFGLVLVSSAFYGLLRFVERTDLLILQERLTHAGAEVHLPLQLADLFLPVTRTLGEGQLRGPAHVLLSPRASVPILRPLRFLGLSFVMKRRISTAMT